MLLLLIRYPSLDFIVLGSGDLVPDPRSPVIRPQTQSLEVISRQRLSAKGNLRLQEGCGVNVVVENRLWKTKNPVFLPRFLYKSKEGNRKKVYKKCNNVLRKASVYYFEPGGRNKSYVE